LFIKNEGFFFKPHESFFSRIASRAFRINSVKFAAPVVVLAGATVAAASGVVLGSVVACVVTAVEVSSGRMVGEVVNLDILNIDVDGGLTSSAPLTTKWSGIKSSTVAFIQHWLLDLIQV